MSEKWGGLDSGPVEAKPKDGDGGGKSWWCDKCSVEVYQTRCPHCGKTKREKS